MYILLNYLINPMAKYKNCLVDIVPSILTNVCFSVGLAILNEVGIVEWAVK